jgi:hypothetical protein
MPAGVALSPKRAFPQSPTFDRLALQPCPPDSPGGPIRDPSGGGIRDYVRANTRLASFWPYRTLLVKPSPIRKRRLSIGLTLLAAPPHSNNRQAVGRSPWNAIQPFGREKLRRHAFPLRISDAEAPVCSRNMSVWLLHTLRLMRRNPRGPKVIIPGPTEGPPAWPRFLRFARTLTLASGVAPALVGWGCGSNSSYDGGFLGSRAEPNDAAASDSEIADARSGDLNVPDAHVTLPYDLPYDGGYFGSRPAPSDGAASDDATTDDRVAYDGRILGVVARPAESGVVAVDAQRGDHIAVGGPQRAPELPDGWLAITEA